MPSEPHGEGDIAVELWKKLEPGEKSCRLAFERQTAFPAS